MPRWTRLLAGPLLAALIGCSACASTPARSAAGDTRLKVVATTGILADLVRNVGGPDVDVTSLVPEGGDPHSYEPSLRDVRSVVYADLAFSNYLMLEEHSIIKTLDANLPPGVPNISLAEGAAKYGAQIIPLVENAALDTIWLGLRVHGTGAKLGATRASEVRLVATGLQGPGQAAAYLTETFGNPKPFFVSRDGFDAGNGYRDDTATLPTDAHTHMSWGFSEPGVYRLAVQGALVIGQDSRPLRLGRADITFAVGVDPNAVPGMEGAQVLRGGHADISVDLDTSRVTLFADPEGGGERTQRTFDPARTVIEVPGKALTTVPADPAFSFLGRPGSPTYLLPQAVLGKHVHGEIDPHLWQNVRNVKAYVRLILDRLIARDPAHEAAYRRRAGAYLADLDRLDAYVAARIKAIPATRRHLVTTHDAFGYLAKAYGIPVAGVLTPNPSVEPSLAERTRLVRTLDQLKIPAVFLEPNLAARSSVLRRVAEERGIQVCPINGDSLTREAPTYVAMMRANADSLHRCLA